jgi:serine protease
MPRDYPIYLFAYLRLLCIVSILMLFFSCSGKSSDEEITGTDKVIAGTITISGIVTMDSDVNDTNAAYSSNDTISNAQPIPNPTVVGGYVNRPGAGSEGRSTQQGDVDDYFQTTLLAGQTIRLLTGNPGDNSRGLNNLDLSLLNPNGEIFNSFDAGNSKTVTVGTTGEYYIRVAALSGASNYLLHISLDAFQADVTGTHQQILNQSLPAQPENSDLDINKAFVPGEIIVKFKQLPQKVFLSSAGNTLRKKAGSLGRNSLYQIERSTNSVSFTKSTNSANDNKDLKQQTLDVIKELRRRPDVDSARPNYIRYPKVIPNDPYYVYQWHFPQINLPQAWETTTGIAVDGNDVVVAVIDTGILPDHPDLQGQIIEGYDFIRDISNADDGDGLDENPFDEGDGTFVPSTFHGTHVAGTIAALSNNSLGVAGIAWGAKIMPLRVLGKQGGTDYDIEQAIRYAAGLENDSGRLPTQPADVINLSLGGITDSTTPPEAFALAREAGVIIVAAAGNEASNHLSYPASLDGVVSVSAVGIDKAVTEYSNFGRTIDVAAPGGSTATDLNGDGYVDGVLSTLAIENDTLEYLYAFYQGTSMAAPHVAGVVALMKSVYRDMTPKRFDQWLASGLLTSDLGSPGRDNYYGHGLIDAYKAVSVASSAAENSLAEPVPVLSANKTVLNFSHDQTQLTFTITKSGRGRLSIEEINVDSPDWLNIVPLSVDSAGLGTYAANLERDFLPQNTSVVTNSINVVSSTGRLIIPVLALSGSSGYQSNAGVHYVLLIDIDSGQVINQVQATAVNGQYTFAMNDVPFGNYILVAGSNPDNNGNICEVAEACGEYPSIGYVEEVTIDESSSPVSTLNFETGFNQIAIPEGQTVQFVR